MSTAPSPSAGQHFQFYCPMSAFEKKDASAGKRLRIGGIISTDEVDQQQERLLQEGLDFSHFQEHGWFNDNHRNDSATDVVGFPEAVSRYAAGDTLPNGEKAARACTWTEGYLVGDKGQKLFDLAQALEGTGRHLGFSVEGTIEKRVGEDKKTIAAAKINHVAVTHVPVATGTKLEVLARSLAAVAAQADEAAAKALTVMGTPPHLSPTPVAPDSTPPEPGDGRALVPSNMARRRKRRRKPQAAAPSAAVAEKSLTHAESLEWVQRNLPGVSAAFAHNFVKTTRALIRAGKL